MPLGSRYKAKGEGDVQYRDNIIRSIIALSLKGIDGIFLLAQKNIRIKKIAQIMNIDIFIGVKSTVSCTEVAYRIQDTIKKALLSMTKYRVSKVGVFIEEVEFVAGKICEKAKEDKDTKQEAHNEEK